jgi:hypothetical protein
MNRKRNNSKNKKNLIKNKKIIRCNLKMQPVFESDTCKDFIKKDNVDSNIICKNCNNSF